MIKVTLLKEHIHQDIKRAEGEVIEVAEHIADWLAEHGVIAPRGAHKPTDPPDTGTDKAAK